MIPLLRVIDALNRNHVRYVVVGGVAVVLHGSNRFTADLDLVVDLSPAAATAAIRTLVDLGMKSRVPVDPFDFAEESQRRSWIDEKGMLVFSMFDPKSPALIVDLFVDPPTDFESLYARSVEINASDVPVRVCGVADLIALKTASGRPQDLQDVADLNTIHNRPGGGQA